MSKRDIKITGTKIKQLTQTIFIYNKDIQSGKQAYAKGGEPEYYRGRFTYEEAKRLANQFNLSEIKSIIELRNPNFSNRPLRAFLRVL